MELIVYFLYFLTAAGNFVFGAVKKRNQILFGVSIILIFILMTFNFEGPDIGVYISAYKTVGNAPDLHSAMNSTYMEFGFTALMIMGNKIGLDFFAFRIILTFVCLSLFCSTIKHYKANGNLIVGLYMLYLFFFDTIQLRNCIAQLIILFATKFLFQKSWRGTFKYIFCVALAASIHTIACIYIAFLLIKVSNNEKFFKNLFIFFIALFLLCIVTKPLLYQLVNKIVSFIGHGSGYLQSSVAYGFWIVLALHFIGIIPLYLLKNSVKDDSVRTNIENIIKINIVLCLFLPLTLFNNNFNRIFRNNMILTQIGFTLTYVYSDKSSRSSQVAMGSLLLLTGGWFFSDMMRYEIEKIISPIMDSNLFFTLDAPMNIPLYLLVISICLSVFVIIHFLKKEKSCNKFKHNNISIDMRQS